MPDYFDTLPGKTLGETADPDVIAAIVAALNTGDIDAALKSLCAANKIDLSDLGVAITSVANYTPFSSLSDEAKSQIAESLGYTVYTDGVFYNPGVSEELQFTTDFIEGVER